MKIYHLQCQVCRELQDVQSSGLSKAERESWICGNCNHKQRSDPALMELAKDMGWAR